MASLFATALAAGAAMSTRLHAAIQRRPRLVVASLTAVASYHLVWRRVAPGDPSVAFAHDGDVLPELPPAQAAGTTVHAQCGPLSVRCVTAAPGTEPQPCAVVLVHGMWHGTWYFRKLQDLLSRAGFTSYAIDLQPAPLRTWKAFASDLLATLDELQRVRRRNLAAGGAAGSGGKGGGGGDDDEEDDAEDPGGGGNGVAAAARVILLGHSQGGILVQTVLRDAAACRRLGVAGAALCGTIPLSPVAAAGRALARGETKPQTKNIAFELGPRAFAFYMLFGRLESGAAQRRIFFLPSTEDTTVCPGGMAEYDRRVVAAPSDGWPTHQHAMSLGTPDFSHLAAAGATTHTPVLVLSADDDVIYQHQALLPVWRRYFPHMEHVVVPRQAHCFADPGWEESFGGAVVDFARHCCGGSGGGQGGGGGGVGA